MILSEVAGGEKECLQHLKDSKKDVRDKDEYNFRVGELHLKLQEFGDAKKVSIIFSVLSRAWSCTGLVTVFASCNFTYNTAQRDITRRTTNSFLFFISACRC